MRLISSQLALVECLALRAAGELTLSDLARAVVATPSAAQRALAILLRDRVVERTSARRPGYRLRPSETTTYVVGLATAEVPLPRAVATAARATGSIEFAARDGKMLIVVFSARSTMLEQARAAGLIEAIASRHGLAVEYHDHDEIRRELLAGPRLRRRMARVEVFHGDLDLTFPDRSRHAMRHGRALHRPHPFLRLPSRRALRALAKSHGLASVKLFGSAVRTDFRPDSDVDVLLRYRAGVRPTLRSLIELERSLETGMGRDVDLIREETLRPELSQEVEREAVRLL